ncbi:MAG: 3-oxoacyl-ACP synthase [Alphaproteobacteria bacterium]|nr:3-oxoacyl-ACP synthase [Alphaproteobacteria bacterium]
MKDVYINGLGAFLPGPPVSSAEMEEYIGRVNGHPSPSRAFVLRQNKIKTRHYAFGRERGKPYSVSEMAALAVKHAADASEITLQDITFLATSTTVGDLILPGTASHTHAALGIPPIEIASFQSVCASSLMAIKSGYLQVKAGEHACVAACGSDFPSRYFTPGFYEGTAVIKEDGTLPMEIDFLRFTLSDGAGAFIIENKPNTRVPSFKIHWIDLRSYADRFETCMMAGGVRHGDETAFWGDFESPAAAAQAGALMLTQDFALLKRMIPVWVSHYLSLIDQGKIKIDAINHLCSHYSSHSLRVETIKLLKKAGAMIDEDKWFSNLYSKGNTGTASIFIMLEELGRSRALKSGEFILCHVPESGRCLNGFMLLEVV